VRNGLRSKREGDYTSLTLLLYFLVILYLRLENKTMGFLTALPVYFIIFCIVVLLCCGVMALFHSEWYARQK
jgi:hypothetical protein